jgi:predicted nucleic acid-binding OB-fold protein
MNEIDLSPEERRLVETLREEKAIKVEDFALLELADLPDSIRKKVVAIMLYLDWEKKTFFSIEKVEEIAGNVNILAEKVKEEVKQRMEKSKPIGEDFFRSILEALE